MEAERNEADQDHAQENQVGAEVEADSHRHLIVEERESAVAAATARDVQVRDELNYTPGPKTQKVVAHSYEVEDLDLIELAVAVPYDTVEANEDLGYQDEGDQLKQLLV